MSDEEAICRVLEGDLDAFAMRRTRSKRAESSMSDEELVSRVLKGDLDAFAFLYARYKGVVFSCLYKLVRDPAAVEELAQQTWISIFNKMTRRRLGVKFSPWAYAFARKQGLGYRRHIRSAARPVSLESMTPGHEPSVPGPADDYEKKTAKERLERNLAKLSPAQRTAVWMRLAEGLSYEEMAKRTGRNTMTLASDVYRGLKHLRENWK